MKKIIWKVATIMACFIVIVTMKIDITSLEAKNETSSNESTAGSGFDPNLIPDGTVDANMKKTANRVSGTVFTILQIAAFGGIIFAGIKYMYSSADQRADIKKNMIYLAIGMVLVFGASTVAKFVTNAAVDVMK